MSMATPDIVKAALVALFSGIALIGSGCAVGFRAYDPEFGVYHHWDRDEESVFRIYLGERHEPYRKYRNLDEGQQREYWRWRHERHEADHHEEDHH